MIMLNGRINGKTYSFINYISENNIRVIAETAYIAEWIIKSAEECKINILEPMLYKNFLRNGCKDKTIFVAEGKKPQINGFIAFNEPVNNIWLKEIGNEWEW